MKEPLVSILIPAYNAQEWIAATIESALQQSWPNKEVIIVDDGSKDGTFEVAKRFTSRGVKLFSKPNEGAAAARNKAFELSRGQYVQWLDADDLISSNKIAVQMAIAQQCGSKRTLISGAWAYFIYRPDKARFAPSALWDDLTPTEWVLRKWEHNAHMQTATWLVSRELTEAAGPWSTQQHVDDDGEYFFRVVLESDGVRFTPESKVYYRAANDNSLSKIAGSDRKKEAQLLGMELQIRKLRGIEDSPRARAAALKYLQTWLIHFYPERLDLVEQAQRLAAELGGKLETPSLRWKYAWIKPLFGYAVAKRAQMILPQMRWAFTRSWDKRMSSFTGAMRKNSGRA